MAVSATSTASKSCSTTVFISHSREATAATARPPARALSLAFENVVERFGHQLVEPVAQRRHDDGLISASVSTASKYCSPR